MESDFNQKKRKAIIYAIILTLLIAVFYVVFVRYEKSDSSDPLSQASKLYTEIKEAAKKSSSSIKTGKEIINNRN